MDIGRVGLRPNTMVMRARPLIAITTSELRRPEDVTARPQGEPPRLEVALGTLYPEAIERAGGVPLIVPLLRPEAVEVLLDRVDGVCLPGGPDLQPSTYGDGPHAELGPTEPRVDAVELALVRAADRLGLPLLGICRGMQALNVARGGTLHQHLPDVVGAQVDHRQSEHGSVATHRVETAPHSRLRAMLGGPALEVNSFHHQAVRALGRGLVATAWAPDGTVEAVEEPGERFVMGVQWHAEGLYGHGPLFDQLVSAAAGEEADSAVESQVVAAGAPIRPLTPVRRAGDSRRWSARGRLAEAG